MDNGTQSEIEVNEAEIEATPDAGGVVVTSRENVEDMLYLADNIDKIIDAQNKIRTAVMRLAQPGDWVLFKGNDEKGKAEIGFAGAMRIGSTLGVNFTNWQGEKIKDRDEIGEWYRWEYECDVTYRSRLVRVYGRASSRDKFLGKVKGEFRPVHEVDEGNIKMIARRAAMKEGVKVLFGLHHMDPEFITKYGVKLDSAGGHSFKSQEQTAAVTEAVTTLVQDVAMRKGKTGNREWTLYIIKDQEGVVYSTFDSKFAEAAKQAKETGARITVHFTTNEKGNTISALVLETN